MAPQIEEKVSSYLEKLRQECREKQWAIFQTRKPAILDDLEAEPPEFQITFLRMVLANAGALTPAPANIESFASTSLRVYVANGMAISADGIGV